MNQELENIKNELSILMMRVDEFAAKQSEQGEFTFTKEQLIKFSRMVIDHVMDEAKEKMKEFEVDDSYVELDLYNREIEVNIDNDGIQSSLVSDLENVDWSNDDDLFDMVKEKIDEMDK